MKSKEIILILSSILLVSCANEATSSTDISNESIPSSILDSKDSENGAQSNESSLESSSSKEEEKKHTLEVTDFPKDVAGKYPADEEIVTSSNDTYFISQTMQGAGTYDGYIQMKKGISFFYSKFAYTGPLSFDVMIKAGYNDQDFTGIPSLYYRSEENSSSNIANLVKTTNNDGLTYHYEANVDGFFVLKNESSYALYLRNFLFN